ncbi:MAG: hypothetical protein VB099_10995 [Candidatus Limiplasma sp.]|nr:hypothetical protein [Candidatus Limiplasma sp.]
MEGINRPTEHRDETTVCFALLQPDWQGGNDANENGKVCAVEVEALG